MQEERVKDQAEHLYLCRKMLFLVVWLPHFLHVIFLRVNESISKIGVQQNNLK